MTPTGKASPYIKANPARPMTPGRGRMVVAPANGVTSEPERERERDRDRDRDRSSPTKVVIVKDDSANRMLGVALMAALMGGILLLVVGVIAFLIWGPQPTPNVSSKEDPIVRPKTSPEGKGDDVWRVGPPGRLVDQVGLVLRMPDQIGGSERLAFSGNGAHVALAGTFLSLVDATRGTKLGDLIGHSAKVTSVAFAPRNPDLLVSGSRDGTVRMWSIKSRRQLREFPKFSKSVLSVVFSPDDQRVLAGGEDNLARLFDANSGGLLKELKGHSAAISSVACRPKGGNQALTASWDKTIRVWNLDNAGTLRTLNDHSDRVNSVAYTPDGVLAVSGGADGKVCLWNVDKGQLLHTFPPAGGAVWSVAVSPDGRRALSSGMDGKIRLWDLQKRTLQHTFEGHTRPVTAVAFAPNGQHFASASEDATFRVWGVPPVQ
jgi:WD40 repeat protein